ncbi:MAG: Crp/Fnr family transcriptional regulator [Bauldia sp.]|nr:Crp/Fnr family transcriptional regulator [Bauldia sp.]
MGSAVPDLDAALAIVSQSGWFAQRPDALKVALRRIARVRRYAPGEPLYLVGDAPNGIFGLVSGGVDIAIPRSDGHEMTVHRADPGFWVGDLAQFTGQERLVSVVASELTVVIHFPQHALRHLVEASPELYPEFYALTYESVRLMLRLIANLASTPSEVRVAMRLLMYDEAPDKSGINISQGKFAELVGLSAPTLQRALRRLQDDNLIRVGYSRIDILDRSGLMSICNASSRA